MALCKRTLVALVALGVLVLSPADRGVPIADACINVTYKGLKPNSKERRAIVDAIAAKDWAKAKTLLLAARAKAFKKRDKVHSHASLIWEAEGWHRVQLARVHYRLGELEAARDEIADARPPRTGTRKRHRAFFIDYALVKSAIDFREGKLEPAIATLESAIKAFPDEARMHAQLGTFHEKNGDLLAAHRALATAVKLSPNHHGGMEWIHLEVVRYRIQLAFYPGSFRTHPLAAHLAAKAKGKKLQRAMAFAKALAPKLPLGEIAN